MEESQRNYYCRCDTPAHVVVSVAPLGVFCVRVRGLNPMRKKRRRQGRNDVRSCVCAVIFHGDNSRLFGVGLLN